MLGLCLYGVDLRCKVAPTGEIMARIADGEGSIIELFPSSAQTSQFAYVGESFTDGFIADGEFLAQYVKCCQNCLLVALLI